MNGQPHPNASSSGCKRRRIREAPNPPHLGELIRESIDDEGLNVTETAARLGCERGFLANWRVDVRVFVHAGERYDIRLSRRPGVDLPGSDTLIWGRSGVPAYLSYKGAVSEASLMSSPAFDGSWSPYHLAMTDDGMYVFSTDQPQLHAFIRDPDSGELALAYRASTKENRDTLDLGNLGSSSHTLWWSALNETLFALAWCGASYSFALPDAGTTLDVRRIQDIDISGSKGCGDPPALGDRDGRHLYAIEASENRLLLLDADSPTSLTHVQTIANNGVSGDDRAVVRGIVRPVDLALAPDGRHLYLLDEFGLFVFSRDTTSGRLAPAGEVSGLPEGADIEAVLLEISVDHTAAFDLGVTLRSPSGAASVLNPPFNAALEYIPEFAN